MRENLCRLPPVDGVGIWGILVVDGLPILYVLHQIGHDLDHL